MGSKKSSVESVPVLDIGAMPPEQARNTLLSCFDSMSAASRLYILGVAMACSAQLPMHDPVPSHSPGHRAAGSGLGRLRLVVPSGSGQH